MIRQQWDESNKVLSGLKVKDPHPLNLFGVFMGTKGFRYLRRLKVGTFEA